MRTLLRRRPSPAMVVACIALLVALSGTGLAAVAALPINSVGTAQLKSNAVTNAKIAANAVTGVKVRNGSLRKADFAAGQIPAGAAGPAGATGPTGAAPAPQGVIGALQLRQQSISIASLAPSQNGMYNTDDVTQNCNAGQKAILGGTGWNPDTDDRELFVVEMRPNVNPAGEVIGYTAKGGNDSGASSTFTLYVLCYKSSTRLGRVRGGMCPAPDAVHARHRRVTHASHVCP